jgi:hypothetical protein
MNAVNILMFVGAGGLFALVVGFFMTGKSSDALKGITNLFGKKQKEKIDEIEKHQKTVAVNIKEKEKLSKESTEKIIEIRKKATVEILNVLKEENIEDIQAEIDEDWDEL